MLRDVRASSLDQGLDLASAFARHPQAFSAFYLAMIQVGELTGKLTEVLKRLALHIEFELDTGPASSPRCATPSWWLSPWASRWSSSTSSCCQVR